MTDSHSIIAQRIAALERQSLMEADEILWQLRKGMPATSEARSSLLRAACYITREYNLAHPDDKL